MYEEAIKEVQLIILPSGFLFNRKIAFPMIGRLKGPGNAAPSSYFRRYRMRWYT